MQRRHAQRSYLNCPGWAESPSRCLGSWSSRQISLIAQIPHNHVECCQCRRTLQGSSQPQNDNTICRRAARNPCCEKLLMMIKIWAWIDPWRLTNGHLIEAKHESKAKTSKRRKWHSRETCTSRCQLFAQRSRSSVILMTSWHLLVQVFAVGESTGNESTHFIGIQRNPTWNIRKSHHTTNCCSKASVHKVFKKITACLLLIIEFNDVNMMALQTWV